MPVFSQIDGCQRVRLDEDDWQVVVAAAAVPDELLGALTPLPVPAPGTAPAAEADATVVSAAALAAGPARVRLDVTTVSGGRGVVAVFGTDGTVAAEATRVLVLSDAGEPTALVPGVELSVFRAEHVVAQVMRLVPPDVPLGPAEPVDSIALPHADALVLAEAVRSGDDALARQVAADRGWSEVPAVLTALADGVRANVTVALRVGGQGTAVVRRWLQSDLGWVGLAVTGEDVVHTPCSRDDVASELVYSLTGAFAAALGQGGPRG